ncbi:valyl-tRNA synthetase [Lysobacter concretionis Ko07 = DSM 16239]|uniref:Valine--tRNA ligase n=1 Tax=Lysobacter concretionis Ko07 = DSM 16239 TaxID=1122185 RepID=A0A0A0ERW1_9GAMM|nr:MULTISPECIES: valine--tRNA ligase [Lysobacter]KGM52970.1 valyl-tRNA synthetase [Lysobacter concretionis Ko07 = DSM 16239]QOD91408.1 valine--tRNA ligase [Lysobacter sp. CW239]
MTDTLASSYDPTQFETRLYQQWEASGVFQPRGEGEPYTILLPPPNVTGTLHMGHAFQHTLQDALVRYHRMRGYDTLWQMGSDHAGIATEMVVARNLALEGNGETRDSLGREGFINKVWDWKQHSGDTIERQMRRIGTSGDWSRSVFTMDPMAAEAVIEAFVKLHEEGLIYRGQRLVNWDPVLKTAISDLEVVNEEEDGFLWSIRYPLSDGSGSLVVATTRPETMLGDTAVMVHPDDERYIGLIGKKVTLPLTGREIPVIADAYVDREFGTGVVKVTPAHDFNDYAVGQRHSLPLINIFTDEATTNDVVPASYRGLDRYDARKAVLADLEAAGLLVETVPHELQVPRGDRSGVAIEPYLTDQWFVKMDTLGARGLELAEKGDVRFVPGNWINTYRHWMENIQDWCISRQLWWGHRIPAWYDEAGNIYVARSEEEAFTQAATKSGGSRPTLRQDDDVLETWFSSALWPFSTMGWPDPARMAERGFDRFVPSSVLVTGFDIIFFWVARMIMMTDHFTGEVPFKDVYITGLIRDAHGQKMSKSKGNIIDPIDLIDGISLEDLVVKRTTGLMKPTDAPKIEKATRREFPDGIPAFGADALRFTIAALATHGRDIRFDMGRAEGYKNFCNKLWNASRFVLMNTEGEAGRSRATGSRPDERPTAAPAGRNTGFSGAPEPKTDAERWILAQLDKTAAQAAQHFAGYRFDLLAQSLYEFAWNDFCDWFVELAKPALHGDDEAAAGSTRHTLLYVLERLLSLLHPLIPFVTEELWQQVAPRLGIDGDTIMLQPYPQAGDIATAGYAAAEADVEWLKAMVSALRRVRSELNVAPSRQVTLLLAGATDRDRERTARFDGSLRFLTKLERIEFIDDASTAPAAATAVVGELKLLVPLEGLVDLGAERARLDKELKRVEVEIGKCNGKLASDTFVNNAPPAVVEQERKRLLDWNLQRDALAVQRAKLG